MERVSEVRDLPIVRCMMSHPTIPIGEWVLVSGPTGVIVRVRVTDTSQLVDRARHIRMKTVEFSYECSFKICGEEWSGAGRDCPVIYKRERVDRELHITIFARDPGAKSTTSLVGSSQRKSVSSSLRYTMLLERSPSILPRYRVRDRCDGEYGSKNRC